MKISFLEYNFLNFINQYLEFAISLKSILFCPKLVLWLKIVLFLFPNKTLGEEEQVSVPWFLSRSEDEQTYKSLTWKRTLLLS